MKLIAALFTVPLLTLTACAGGSPDDPRGADIEAQPYRGETLTCVETGAGETKTLSCDFTAFYRDHTDLLADASEGEEDAVTWVEYEGKPLACIREGAGKTARQSCDFERFYANNPSLWDK